MNAKGRFMTFLLSIVLYVYEVGRTLCTDLGRFLVGDVKWQFQYSVLHSNVP